MNKQYVEYPLDAEFELTFFYSICRQHNDRRKIVVGNIMIEEKSW